MDQKLTKLVQKWTIVVWIEFNLVQNCGNLPMFRFRWFEWLVAGKLANNDTLIYFSYGTINMVKQNFTTNKFWTHMVQKLMVKITGQMFPGYISFGQQ